MDQLSDRELVGRFLAAFAGYSGQEVRERVPGVTEHDVSRWRRDDYQFLTEKKRRAVEAALAAPETDGPPTNTITDRVRRLETAMGQMGAWARWVATSRSGEAPEWMERAAEDLRRELDQGEEKTG